MGTLPRARLREGGLTVPRRVYALAFLLTDSTPTVRSEVPPAPRWWGSAWDARSKTSRAFHRRAVAQRAEGGGGRERGGVLCAHCELRDGAEGLAAGDLVADREHLAGGRVALADLEQPHAHAQVWLVAGRRQLLAGDECVPLCNRTIVDGKRKARSTHLMTSNDGT